MNFVLYETTAHWCVWRAEHVRRVLPCLPCYNTLSANLFQLCSQERGDWITHHDPGHKTRRQTAAPAFVNNVLQ